MSQAIEYKRRFWSKKQETELALLADKGVSVEELSRILKRSPGSVKMRLYRMGYAKVKDDFIKPLHLSSNGHPIQPPLTPLDEAVEKSLSIAEVKSLQDVVEPPSTFVQEESPSLLIEFVKMAWNEGHAIEIPALGAIFQKRS